MQPRVGGLASAILQSHREWDLNVRLQAAIPAAQLPVSAAHEWCGHEVVSNTWACDWSRGFTAYLGLCGFHSLHSLVATLTPPLLPVIRICRDYSGK